MATGSTRTLWKGAISFGLVHVPVALHSATEDTRPKMRMLDQETGAPIAYQKVDKATGREVVQSEVTKGIEVGVGQYVTLSKDEIREALPKTTQMIEIEAFVKLQDIPPTYFNKPYYVAPAGGRGAPKVYALLRDVLKRTGRVGLGRVVVSTNQHLAIVAPQGAGMVVCLLRWNDEVRDIGALPLPGESSDLGVTERDLEMGEQLVLDLADDWHPERFRDEFKAKVEQLIEAKRHAGQVRQVQQLMGEEIMPSADVVDLTDLLKRSLQSRGSVTPSPAPRMPRKAASGGRSTRTASNDAVARERAAAAAGKGSIKARSSVPVSKPGQKKAR